MRPQNATLTKGVESTLEVNRVLRNTYLLLSLTLLFSSATAWYAMVSNAKPIGLLLMLVGIFGLYFLTVRLRNSIWGIAAIFAYTGFLGYTLGPFLNALMHNFTNGGQIIMTSLGATGMITLGLSAYALTSRKNFSYLGGFISVAIIGAFLLGIAGIVFHMPMLQLVISGGT